MKFTSLDDFIERGLQDLGSKAAAVSRKVTDQVRDRAVELSKEVAPVDSGELRDSFQSVDEGGLAKAVSDAPHGGIINRGRKRGITPRGEKRVRARKGEKNKPNPKAPMLGSPKAPQGITRPVRRQLAKEFSAIVEKAVAEVGR